MPDQKYIIYEQRKKIISETSKTPEEYERRIKKLSKELKI